jgi:hypothetical protein
MAKNKLTITDIQKALLTNTRFIKEAEEEVLPDSPAPAPPPAPVPVDVKLPEVQIDPIILKKLRILAAYQKTTATELINSALGHYLRLKAMQLDEAMLKLTE